jgi:hypothetical protein
MIKYFFLIIIILIIVLHFINYENEKPTTSTIKAYNNNNMYKYSNINERFMDNINLKNEKSNIWSNVIDNNYYINVKPDSMNDFKLWKNYNSNINFDSEQHKIIINSNNENEALVFAFSILLHFNGTNTFEESISILENNMSKINTDINLKNNLTNYIHSHLNNNEMKNIKMNKKVDIKTNSEIDINSTNELEINVNNNLTMDSIDAFNGDVDNFDVFNGNIDNLDNGSYSYI